MKRSSRAMRRNSKTLADLRAGFMSSPEFVATTIGGPVATPSELGTKPVIWPATKIQVKVPLDILDHMDCRVNSGHLGKP
jgi:hypothetical protein